MKEFFVQNWQFFVALFVSVITSVMVWFIRKKPVLNEMDNILLRILENLPIWIIEVETLKGADVKKTAVLETCKKYARDEFSVILPQTIISYLGTCIEYILETPQKHLEV